MTATLRWGCVAVMYSSTQSFSDTRQVMPAVPKRVVFNNELGGDRRAEAQGEGCCAVQLVVRECANRVSRGATVSAQQFDRGRLGHICLIVGMFRVQLRDSIP